MPRGKTRNEAIYFHFGTIVFRCSALCRTTENNPRIATTYGWDSLAKGCCKSGGFRNRYFCVGSDVLAGSLAPCWRFRVAAGTSVREPKPQRHFAQRRGLPQAHSTPSSCRLDRGSSSIGEVHVWAHPHGIDTFGCHTG